MNMKNSFARSAKGLGGVVRRAAMMLLMMMLTTATAWATDVTAVYALTCNTTTQKTILTRNNGNGESVTWNFDTSGISPLPWAKNASHGVDDEYDITFKPNNALALVGSYVQTSGQTTFTVNVGAAGYYIKSANIGGVTATAGLNAKSLTVTVPDDTNILGFNVTLTDDFYGTVTPASGLAVTSSASVTEGGTKYYKAGTTVTVAATNQYDIVENPGGTGSASVTVADDRRSFSFTMPDQNVSPTATLTEVHTITVNSPGLSVTSSPYFTYSSTKYYKTGVTYTLTVDDANKIIDSFTATGADGSIATNKKSATVTIGNSDVTVTATIIPDPTHFAKNSDGSYTIKSVIGWGLFCELLEENAEGYFTGKTVNLDGNIGSAANPVTSMAGTSSKPFTGTFDGKRYKLTVSYQNTSNTAMTAPFSYVDGATIQNLVVDGSITGSAYRAAGVIGETGTNKSYITNCVSSLTISSGRYTGGFSIGGNVEIKGCVFNGKINGNESSGGFVGYSNSNLKIKDCLFAPQSGSSISGGTFYFNGGGEITPTNCYYTTALGTAQGTAPRSVTKGDQYVTTCTVSPIGSSTDTYDLSGITAYRYGIERNGTFYYGDGDQVSLTLAHSDRTGYNFNSYTASAGTLNGKTLTMPDANVTISTTWTAITYSVAFDGNGYTSGSMNNQSFAYDEAQNLTANAFKRVFTVTYHYNGATGGNSEESATATATFNGWAKSKNGAKVYDDGQLVSNLTNEGNATVTLFANWTDASVTLPTPTKTGYTFAGWYTDSELNTRLGDAGDAYTPSEDIALYAKWTPITYYVAFDGNGSTSGSMDNQAFYYDVEQALADNAYRRAFTVTYHYNGATGGNSEESETANATFNGWATTDNGAVDYNNQQSVTNLADTNGATVNLFANWTDASVTLPTPAKTGYTFAGWYSDALLTTFVGDAGDAYTPSEDITLYAKWTPITYYVAFDGNGSTSGSMSNQTFTYGTAQNLTANTFTRTGYTFAGWAMSDTGDVVYRDQATVNNLTDTADGTVTLYAKWTPITYYVAFDGNGATSGSMDNQAFYYDVEQALADNAYRRAFTVTYHYNGATGGNSEESETANATFNGWATTDNGAVDYNNQQSITNLADTNGATVNLFANWTDASVTLPTPTKTGYTFAGWYTDSEYNTRLGDAGDAYTPSEDIALYAKWHVPYINAGGNTQQCANYTVLTGSETRLNAGWYVAEGTLSYSQRITLYGDVTIILKDGAVMNVGTEENPIDDYGIIGEYCSFSIYAQSTGDSKGQLRVNATDDAIYTKDVTISGGQVTANGGSYGIISDNNVTISGGQVTASGNDDGIEASGNVTISGGQVTVNGDYFGIYASSDLTLGWTSLTDFIQANSYFSSNGTFSIAEGKAFAVYNGTTLTSYLPSGTLSSTKVSTIGGKTLRPVDNIPVVAPQNLTITNVTLTGATLTWEPGNVETQWQVAYSTDGGSTWSNDETVTTTTYTLTGLPAGTSVTVRVRAYYNDNLYSDFATSTFTTLLPPVSYLDADGNPQQCADYTILTGSETSLDAGWYVAEGTLNYSQAIELNGDVTIILKDKAVMNVGTEEHPIDEYSISGSQKSLSIYAQSTGDSKGQLHVNATYDAIYAKNVTISGGLVTVSGNNGIYTSAGNVTISGGQVTANGSSNGIHAYGNVTLGWTSLTDFIQANSYFSENGTVSIAEGKAFAVYNGTTLTSYLPSGTLSSTKVSTIGGKTLRPVTSIPVVAPQNLTITNVTLTGATLTWQPGNVETQWQVTYSTDGGSNWSDAETVTETTYTLTGLPTGTSVTVRVRAYYNDNLYSDFATTFTTLLPPVSYLDADGTPQQCTDYTILTGSETSLAAGWYVAEGTLTYSQKITLYGEVHLILKDGAAMNVGTEENPIGDNGISGNNYSFCIYAQSTGGDKGQLYINATYNAIYTSTGNITISGGQMTVNGNVGIQSRSGNLTISGGQVTASGSYYGIYINGGNVTISGGQVTANGGSNGIIAYGDLTLGWTSLTDFIQASSYYSESSVTIAEDKVFSVYDGENFMSYLPSGTLTSQQVKAIGGKTLRPVAGNPVPYIDADGDMQLCMDYTVLTGSETSLAEGWYVAKGTLNYGETITLSGKVHLILQDGAVMNVGTEQTPVNNGIYANGHSLSIYAQSTGGGKLNLYADPAANGIDMENGDLTIHGGEVTATGAIAVDGGTLTLGWTSLTDFITAATYQFGVNASVAIAGGKAFKVYDGESLVAFLGSGTLSSEQVAALGGKTLRPSRTSTVEAPQHLVASLTLANALTSARLSWQSDDDVSQWQVACSTDGGSTWSDDVTVTEPAYSVAGLTEGTTLTVRVRSVYSATLCSDYATCAFNALSSVAYLDAEGNTQYCNAYTTLTGTETSIGIESEDSWYVASGRSDYDGCITLADNVHLILADDAEVNFPEANPFFTDISDLVSIYAAAANLTIYGQTEGTGTINARAYVVVQGDVTVNGGTLNATAALDLGLTNGAITTDGNFIVNGGTVFAQNPKVAIVTSSDDNPSSKIIINGGKVTAISGYYGIFARNDEIIIRGGQVTAQIADELLEENGIDKSKTIGMAAGGNITLGATKASDFICADRYATIGALSIADGTTLYDEDGNTYSGIQTLIANPDADPDNPTAGTYAIDGKTLRPVELLVLANNGNNGTVISDNAGQTRSVMLQGRTLYKDGDWNTLCLPFDVVLAGSPLDDDGVDVRTLSSSSFSGGTLTLNFTPATGEEAVTTLQAGRPYIIRWPDTGKHLTENDLVFPGVTIPSGYNSDDAITTALATASSTDYVDFIGTFSPTVIYESGDKTKLYLGAENALYYPLAEGFQLKACRGYFHLKNGLTAGEPSSSVRAFNLNFGDEATGVTTPLSHARGAGGEAWYSLDGVRLDAQPTRKGLYIHGGRKVVIP